MFQMYGKYYESTVFDQMHGGETGDQLFCGTWLFE